MNLQSIKLNIFLKLLTILGAFVFSFALANQALAGTAEIRAKSASQGSFADKTWVTAGDTFSLRIFYLGDSPASAITLTLPNDLQFSGGVTTLSGNNVSTQTNGQIITFNFTSSSAELFSFNATVVSGISLSTNHVLSLSFTTNGTPTNPTNGTNTPTTTIYTGPILKTISTSTGTNTGLDSVEPITGITLTGHGFTQTSDITSLTINGQDMTTGGISVTGPDGSGYYTISGARIPLGVTVGTYYVILTTTVAGTALATEANAVESVAFTVTEDTVHPTATVAYTQNSASTTSVKAGDVTVTATFSEPISTTPNIAIDQPGATDIAATAMTLPTGGDRTIWTYTYTINAVADGTATVMLTNAPDYANNTLSTVTGNTFVIDTFGPTPAITNLAGAAAGQTALTFSWTSTYTASDFSTYKFYYRTATGVTSANGTEINKSAAGYSSLGTAATNSLNLSGLTAGTRYYAVLYICDVAGNCSSASNEGDAQTNSQAVISVPTSSGGGGGSSAPSAPSTASSAGAITAAGGAITTTTASGSSAMVSIPANTASGLVSVSEASTTEKQSAPLSASDGIIVGNTVFNIQLSGVSSPTFANPVTLEFVYEPAQLSGLNPSLLNISYFSTALNKWVSLPSTINTTTHKVTAQTTHFTLFAITTVPAASGSTTNTTPADTTTTTPPATTESGQVLGSSVGVYPNGSLLKAPNSPAVFYIANDQKHVITSAAVFNTRFNWNDIVYLPSTRQLDLYEAGDAVSFSAGTLAKEEGKSAVYRISATGGKQPILSANVFLSRGYKWNQVIEVAPNALASYPEQAYISSADNFYTGDVVKVAATAKIYQIETGLARLVPNVDVLQANKLDKKPIRNITAKEFKQFTAAADLFYPNGTLVKSSSSAAIYIISDGKKRAFASGADLDAMLYNRKRIRTVADKILAAMESLAPIKLAQKNIHTANAE